MRRRDPVRIGDALNDFFSSTPVIARKIAEAKIPDLWPVLVGNVIASYTTKIELRTGGRLFVHLSSSVARNGGRRAWRFVCGRAKSYLTMTDDTIRMPEASLIASISAERRMNTSLRATDELR